MSLEYTIISKWTPYEGGTVHKCATRGCHRIARHSVDVSTTYHGKEMSLVIWLCYEHDLTKAIVVEAAINVIEASKERR